MALKGSDTVRHLSPAHQRLQRNGAGYGLHALWWHMEVGVGWLRHGHDGVCL